MSSRPGPPPAEVEIDAALVRRLLESQHPDLAERPLASIGHGWDNAMFRLGDDLVMRLPRRALAADLVRHEQAVLPRIAAGLPIPVPEPVRLGAPAEGYPWFWSVQRWFDGEEAAIARVDAAEAPRLAAFLRALHQPAPDDAPENPFRGVPLVERRPVVDEWLATLRATSTVVTPAIDAIWNAAVAAPVADEAVWLHGDLHPRNVLVRDGRFAAVIDWGDVTSGDAACDLASIWMLLDDAAARAECLRCYAPDAAMVTRAIGSAVSFAAVFVARAGVDDPRLDGVGRATFRRVEDDLASGLEGRLPAG